MSNRLGSESSPYLLQHAGNPVDWYPWGDEAFERARREEKPVLLSVGYAACHWCHVMAHESFEDPSTAAIMNEHFVNVKVDREERPDVDQIYMQAVQAMTGHGGWPMTVFLTPGGEPFYGGTYFPPDDRHGMPSFRRLLLAIVDAWRSKQEQIGRTVQELSRLYAVASEPMRSGGPLTPALLERAWRTLASQHDARHGGFGGAPRFPNTMAIDFLLRFARRTGTAPAMEIVTHSFTKMAEGGIYDQLGGGFHRYAVDDAWLVPHFEKMLYDNALLARLGVHLWQMNRDLLPRRIAEETIEWVRREMTSPEGGFYATLDADSEGEEGRYYVWTEAEIDAAAGDDAPLAKAYWGVTAGGNFEGRTILTVAAPAAVVAARHQTSEDHVLAAVERARTALIERRERRVRPGRDEKIIASWNGLMLRAVADAARAFGRDDFRTLALSNARFLFDRLVDAGRVRRSWKDGAAGGAGYLEDHAAVGLAALAMYELTFDRRWLDHAVRLGATCVTYFFDDEVGAFFDTASDHEQLISRPREFTDNATPSGTSLATELLLRLAELTGDSDARRRAVWVLETLAEPMARYPLALGHLLGVADTAVHGAVELAIVGDPDAREFRALAAEAASRYVPSMVIAGGPPAETPALLHGRTTRGGRATAYVCRGYACDAPADEPSVLGEQLERAARTTAG